MHEGKWVGWNVDKVAFPVFLWLRIKASLLTCALLDNGIHF